ncbi:MAG TPA: dipeptide epimerase [Sphingomicrobium sp.]|jgi:L-alanine-DL-glutamate epimerase-like enolase superfamily enzyme|nr:dipeptide epimerase [Sphingomicrobium sp.]
MATTTTAARALTVERAATRFATPLRISGYVFEAMPSVVATIADSETVGRGEAAGVYYLGDDQDRMVATIDEVRPAIESGLDREGLQSLLPPCGARNALDCALWELEARLSRVPVWELAGVPMPKPLVTVFTLPADDPPQIATRLATLRSAKAIKLKLDGVLDADRDRLAAVRSARPDVWLSVDANQGYGAADLDALSRLLSEFSVALVEQPVARGQEAVLKHWRPGIPVAADESIVDLTELRERADLFDVVNIKLDKSGGLTEALSMARAARLMGKQVMVGNMGGSTLAMAPGFVLGQLCDHVDLDGPYGLEDDALAQTIYSDGRIFVPETVWGFGASQG